MTYNPIQLGQKTMANSSPVVFASDQSALPVTGTFWQATQPVSIAATVAVSGTFWQATQPVSIAAGATNVAKAEDDASANADVGIPAMAIRKATPANTSGTDGDYEMLQMSAGRLWVDASGKTLTVDGSGVTQPVSGTVTVTQATASNLKVDLSGTAANATAIKVDGSAVTQPVSGTVTASNATGNVAHDSVDSGNPVKIGGKARTTNPTAVADADRVDAAFDTSGRIITQPVQCRDLLAWQQTTITSSTSETTIISAAGAGVFADIVSLWITNSSASALTVTLKDSTAGTTRGKFAIAANGGICITPQSIGPQATANNNWTLTCGTSVASVEVTALYAKNK